LRLPEADGYREQDHQRKKRKGLSHETTSDSEFRDPLSHLFKKARNFSSRGSFRIELIPVCE
jgi:hypothetical protein